MKFPTELRGNACRVGRVGKVFGISIAIRRARRSLRGRACRAVRVSTPVRGGLLVVGRVATGHIRDISDGVARHLELFERAYEGGKQEVAEASGEGGKP